MAQFLLDNIYFILGALAAVVNKPLRDGIGTSIGALLVFSFVIGVGIIYSPLHAIVLAWKERSVRTFFKYIWRLINGTLTALGDFLKFGIAYRYDELGNVWGEWIEDGVTTEEKTKFGDHRTTVSASIGQLEYSNAKIFDSGKGLSRCLNFVFKQTRHCIGSWEKKIAIKEIDDKNLHGNLK